jgi:hypothetical protein
MIISPGPDNMFQFLLLMSRLSNQHFCGFFSSLSFFKTYFKFTFYGNDSIVNLQIENQICKHLLTAYVKD